MSDFSALKGREIAQRDTISQLQTALAGGERERSEALMFRDAAISAKDEALARAEALREAGAALAADLARTQAALAAAETARDEAMAALAQVLQPKAERNEVRDKHPADPVTDVLDISP